MNDDGRRINKHGHRMYEIFFFLQLQFFGDCVTQCKCASMATFFSLFFFKTFLFFFFSIFLIFFRRVYQKNLGEQGGGGRRGRRKEKTRGARRRGRGEQEREHKRGRGENLGMTQSIVQIFCLYQSQAGFFISSQKCLRVFLVSKNHETRTMIKMTSNIILPINTQTGAEGLWPRDRLENVFHKARIKKKKKKTKEKGKTRSNKIPSVIKRHQ